jgi:hypothetical protein
MEFNTKGIHEVITEVLGGDVSAGKSAATMNTQYLGKEPLSGLKVGSQRPSS